MDTRVQKFTQRPPNGKVLARLTDAHCHPADDVSFEAASDAISQSKLKHIVSMYRALLEETSSRMRCATQSTQALTYRPAILLAVTQCAMSSNLANQHLTRRLSEAHPDRVIPFFGKDGSPKRIAAEHRYTGVHPWFIHPIGGQVGSSRPDKERHYERLFPPPASDSPSRENQLPDLLPSLPGPVSLDDWISNLDHLFSSNKSAMLGEIGFDKAFRIPNPTPPPPPPPPPTVPDAGDNDNGTTVSVSTCRQTKNSDLQTPVSHQTALVRAQLKLAVDGHLRHVSFHCVRAVGETVALLEWCRASLDNFDRVHVCLHSFGGSPESVKQIQKS